MTDAPERLWLWRNDDGSWLLIETEWLAPDTATEYVRKDATFTADDLRRAWEIALLMAALKLRGWAARVDASEFPMTAKVLPTLVDTTTKVFADLTPPDDLPALVKGSRDE